MTAKHETVQTTQRTRKPHQEIRSLEKLVGTWQLSGPEVSGQETFKWLEGGFFLVQSGIVQYGGKTISFVEYIGYDEKQHACTSNLFDNFGDLFNYTWDINGDDITIWFGQRGSDNCFKGKFSKDGNSFSGAWKWPGGGYEATMTKVK